MSVRIRLPELAAVGLLALAPLGCRSRATDVEPGPIPAALTPARPRPASPELIASGRRTYEKQCRACHGAAGDGQGEAA